jgi:cytochrome c
MSSRYDHPCIRPDTPAKGRMTIALLSVIAVYVAGYTPAFAAGDAASGKRLYETRCLGCHGDGGSAATLGPSLVGIIGRKAGTGESGVHSRALTESNIRWDETSLRWFLAAPIAGTTMPAGVDDPQEIDDLIAYLKTLR